MCHVVRRDSSAIKFDRVEIAWGRGEEYPERKCHILKTPEITAPTETGTRTLALVAG